MLDKDLIEEWRVLAILCFESLPRVSVYESFIIGFTEILYSFINWVKGLGGKNIQGFGSPLEENRRKHCWFNWKVYPSVLFSMGGLI